VFWNNNVIVKVNHFSQYHIDAEFAEPEKDKWRLTFMYGEAKRNLRHRTWELMKFMRGESDLHRLCMGDFNEILRREEQFGANDREEYLMEGFREAVDVCGLCDIGYRGLDWTWEKKVSGGNYVLSPSRSGPCYIKLV
jgi:hypothetical protein